MSRSWHDSASKGVTRHTIHYIRVSIELHQGFLLYRYRYREANKLFMEGIKANRNVRLGKLCSITREWINATERES